MQIVAAKFDPFCATTEPGFHYQVAETPSESFDGAQDERRGSDINEDFRSC